MVRPVAAAALLLMVAAAGSTSAQTQAKSAVYDVVALHGVISRISAAASNEERGNAIRSELAKLKIRVSTEGFSTGGRPADIKNGLNLIAEVSQPSAKRTVMIGAHYDRVANGQGAVDNASGSAAVLELLRIFTARPMKNVTLKAAFWDLEEGGLLGSKTYAQTRGEGGLPDMYINFDVFGYGDTLWFWSATETSEFTANVLSAAKSRKHGARNTRIYPPSDHLSFQSAGVETYSFSLLPLNEIESVTRILGALQPDQKDIPLVLRTIHTDGDTIEKIDAAAIVKALPIIEEAIRKLDKSL
jgi:aminopeptidase S